MIKSFVVQWDQTPVASTTCSCLLKGVHEWRHGIMGSALGRICEQVLKPLFIILNYMEWWKTCQNMHYYVICKRSINST